MLGLPPQHPHLTPAIPCLTHSHPQTPHKQQWILSLCSRVWYAVGASECLLKTPTESQYSPPKIPHLETCGSGLQDNLGQRSQLHRTEEPHLCIRVDVFIESLECIYIELHQLPQEVKVALEHIPRFALTVHNAVQDVLRCGGERVKVWIWLPHTSLPLGPGMAVLCNLWSCLDSL